MESVRRKNRLDISIGDHSFNKENISKTSYDYKIRSEKSLNSSYLQISPSKSPTRKPTLNLNNLSYCPTSKGLINSPISPIRKSFFLSPCSNHIQLPLEIYHRERREIKKPYSNEFCNRSPNRNRTPSHSPVRLQKKVGEKSPLQIPKLEINKTPKNEEDNFSSKLCESVDNGELTFNPSVLSSRCSASPRCIENKENDLNSISYRSKNFIGETDFFKKCHANKFSEKESEENEIDFSEMKTQRRNEPSIVLSNEMQYNEDFKESSSYSPKYKVINSDDFLNALRQLALPKPSFL
ncbi:unnamed protein product [Blepharisma stoltei]|uniref:Uncharacterized protein n=1 Tax=Blepharisma stoltei TaxID=1481888 RepID=A0AAU9ITT1_9CILI|nr:unnamed protein product [Blepharisma stoltei]